MNVTRIEQVSGTTHDPVDHTFEHNGKSITLIDTAGIRKRTIREVSCRSTCHPPLTPLQKGIEQLITMRALATIEKCHVAILLIDPISGVTPQDQMIATHIVRHNKSGGMTRVPRNTLTPVSHCRRQQMGSTS